MVVVIWGGPDDGKEMVVADGSRTLNVMERGEVPVTPYEPDPSKPPEQLYRIRQCPILYPPGKRMPVVDYYAGRLIRGE